MRLVTALIFTVINSVSNPTATISAAPADSESGQSMTSDTKVKLGLGIGLGVPCFCILSYMLYLLINLNRRHSALEVSLSISDNKGKERDQNLSSVFTAGSVDELPAHPPLPKKPELEGTSRHIPSPAASREPRFGSTSTIPGTHELRAESRGQSSVDLAGRGKCSTTNERTTPSPVVGSSVSKGVRRPDRTRRPETERRRRRREQGRD